MGATVAAWNQAARAELAAASKDVVAYGQALLDLVKAFDRVPHRLLAREAAALGFPLWMVKLSIATYRLKRVIRIGTVVSWELVALRGITAGPQQQRDSGRGRQRWHRDAPGAAALRRRASCPRERPRGRR